jgi:tetratricopeptide (TPR) repeat protein
MFEGHPTSNDFNLFLRGTSHSGSAARNARVLRHLLAACAACRQHLNEIGWDGSRLESLVHTPSVEPADRLRKSGNYNYEAAFAKVDRAVSALLAKEQPAARRTEDLLTELLSCPEKASHESRFATPQVVKALIDRSHAVRYQNPEEMLHLASLAQIVAETCSSSGSDSELRLADLRVRAWGQFGNALRVSGRPREAEEALTKAQGYRQKGTGDPALKAWLLEKVTPLDIFKGRFDKAIESIAEAGRIYRELGETHLLASTMVQKAIACLYKGDTESAIPVLNQAIPLIDHEVDPHLLLAACHNLLRAYIDLDRPEQARCLYSEIRPLYQEFTDSMILLRAAWQEGQLLRDLGHLRAAEETLLRARKGFLEKNLAFEVAAVSLDLAAIYVRLGLVEEVKNTVTTALPIFRALEVGREALGSLLQLQQVADQEQQALELIRSLNARIQPLARRTPAK